MILDCILIVLIIALVIIVYKQRNKEVELEADNDELRNTIIQKDLKIEDKDRRIAMLERYPEPELHYEGVPVYNVSFKVQCLDDTLSETSLKLTLRAMCHSHFKQKPCCPFIQTEYKRYPKKPKFDNQPNLFEI